MVVGAFLSVAYFFFRLVSRQGLICRAIGLSLVPGGFLMSSAFVFCPAGVFCYVVSVLAMFFRRVPFSRVNSFPTGLFPGGRASFYRVVCRHIFLFQPLVFESFCQNHS